MIEFPPFTLDRRAGLLWRHERPVPLRPKTWALLCYLAEHPGLLVTKDELALAVWKQPAVSDDAISRTLGELRRALDDHARQPGIVQTVHRRGFRFIAPIVRASHAADAGASGRHANGDFAGAQRIDAEPRVARWMGREALALRRAWDALAAHGEALDAILRTVTENDGPAAIQMLADRLDALNEHTWSFAALVAASRRALPPAPAGILDQPSAPGV